MKCTITGHTHGIGKELYNHFVNKGWDVVGFSRSNGYDLNTSIEQVVSLSKGSDLFINNTFGPYQIDLLNQLQGSVPKIIVLGSIAGDYFDQMLPQCKPYGEIKNRLETQCKYHSARSSSNILYLKISMLENALSCDNPINYKEVTSAVDWWLDNPRINQMDFELKLTDYTVNQIKERLGIDLSKE